MDMKATLERLKAQGLEFPDPDDSIYQRGTMIFFVNRPAHKAEKDRTAAEQAPPKRSSDSG
jgi:hypothetical protein